MHQYDHNSDHISMHLMVLYIHNINCDKMLFKFALFFEQHFELLKLAVTTALNAITSYEIKEKPKFLQEI